MKFFLIAGEPSGDLLGARRRHGDELAGDVDLVGDDVRDAGVRRLVDELDLGLVVEQALGDDLGDVDVEADKLARLRSAAVFCAPSLHGESFGVVLIEAMAAGTPVVASALDGYRNVATDGVDALLVEPGDAVALAGALERVLGDPTLADRLVTAGSARADQFAMGALADRYAAIYASIAK